MKINIADQSTAAQKTFEIEDEQKSRLLFDKRIAQEISGDLLGEQYADYVFKITGGFDKDGFAMKQGVLFAERKFLLLGKEKGFYRPKRDGCRKRKAVRGAIIGPDISVVNVVISKRGKQAIEGVTDTHIPSRLGPKRASKIRKLFNLSKKDDVRKFVIRRPITKNGKVVRTKAPKIQRLVTPERLQRKRHIFAIKKNRIVKAKTDAAAYQKLLTQRRAETRKSLLSKKSVRKSEKSEKPAAVSEKKEADKKVAGKKVAEKKPVEKKVTEKKVTEKKVTEKKVTEKKVAEKKPAEKKVAEKKPAEKKSAEKKSAEKKPAEKKSAEKKPAEKKSAEKKPAEKKSAEKKPAEKKPAEKKVTEKKPAEKKPAVPAEKKVVAPVEKKVTIPAAEKAAEKKPAEKKATPAKKKPAKK